MSATGSPLRAVVGDATLTLRPLRLEDLPDVAAVHVEAFRDAGEDALARARSSLEEELSRPWAHVTVACLGARIVGASVAWRVADEVHVLDVATLPEARRRGVGRALVRGVIALARGGGARHLYLEVRPSNAAALALYRGEGFAAVGVRQRYYSDDEDAVEMALGLDPNTGAVERREDEVDVPTLRKG